MDAERAGKGRLERSPGEPGRDGRPLALGEQAERAGLMVAARAIAHGLRQGRWKTGRRGASTEFYDYREHAPGDPARLVDWRVYARTDRHYVRRFRHESQQTVAIALDGSASMAFAGLPEEVRRGGAGAGPSKLGRARELAAAIAYLAVRQGDRIALATADARGVVRIGPGAGTAHLRVVVGALEAARAGGDAGLAGALGGLGLTARDRGVVVAIGDALDEPELLARAIAGAQDRCGRDGALLQVLTDDELDLSALGAATLADPEGEAAVPAFGDETAEGYALALGEHLARLDERLERLGVRRTLARTSGRPIDALRAAFGGRSEGGGAGGAEPYHPGPCH